MEEVPAFIVKSALAFSDAPTLVRAGTTCSAWRQHAEEEALWAFLLSLRPAPALVSYDAALPRQEFIKTVQAERLCLDYLKRLGIHGDYAGDILAEARSALDARYCLQLLWFVHQYYDSQTVSYGGNVEQCRDDLIAYMGQLFPAELVHLVCNELHVQFAANKLYATMQGRILVPAWEQLLSLPIASHNMIDGAYLLAVAHTPHLKRSDMDQPIKRIAERVWHNMGFGKCDWIGDVQIVEEAKQACYNTPVMDMLQCVNDVMYNKLKFTGATTDYYTPQVSCIDKHTPAANTIMYTTITVHTVSTVCAAIGMRHVPYGINMPGHFVLGCKLSDDTGSAITNTVVIDAYECGELVQLQGEAALELYSDTEFEQLALQQQPCSTIWMRCLNNLANVYSGEPDNISNYITTLQTAALEPYGTSYRRAEAAQAIGDYDEMRREYEVMTDELRDAPPWAPTAANLSINRKVVVAL
eukprot:848-Heterococcus_DN1.PRE.3